jgi:hypothetical protein
VGTQCYHNILNYCQDDLSCLLQRCLLCIALEQLVITPWKQPPDVTSGQVWWQFIYFDETNKASSWPVQCYDGEEHPSLLNLPLTFYWRHRECSTIGVCRSGLEAMVEGYAVGSCTLYCPWAAVCGGERSRKERQCTSGSILPVLRMVMWRRLSGYWRSYWSVDVDWRYIGSVQFVWCSHNHRLRSLPTP